LKEIKFASGLLGTEFEFATFRR